ncbi:TetR/AcrR family transcriptional regulator [Pseudonocardia sp. N23]|uniref:TetR/AcrR family transcriptional regulator n=1 Tax=Pseudonocardia sp. N23 TaxID=1987376 RepID=UPI000BFB49D2|nr:TetR family transcriptional regulator [Pseudonocardia sp. N23]GAY08224.1 transcriptional regulator, tetr family [Pseudonocardia sp. N23]
MTFQRARSAEQREERRRSILDAASAMLTEMPVSAVTLNELARRVGLAKSNVLRYFDSREAVLLELLHAAFTEWLDTLRAESPATVADRGEWLAAVLATSLRERPVLCDLFASQASVLEHNVSPEVAADFKRKALADVMALAEVARAVVPELEEDALALAATVVMSAGAIWSHTCPSEAMKSAYEADPALAALALPLGDTLQTLFATLVAGLLARRDRGLSATLPGPWKGGRA